MKHIILFILLFTLKINAFSQDKLLLNETIEFILDNYKVSEFNPIHQQESFQFDSLFKISLINHFEKKGIEKNPNHSEIFTLLHSNSIMEYEDSPDYRRMVMRRSLCFSTLALISELSSAFTYIDYAKYSIKDNCSIQNENLLEHEYCGLLFLELILAIEYNEPIKTYLIEIEKYIIENQNLIDSSIFNSAYNLIRQYKE